MKTKEQLSELDKRASNIVDEVIITIINETRFNSLILFDPSKVDDDEELRDNIYDFPYAYYVDKHEFHCSAVVQKVSGEEVTIFFTGEYWGEIYTYRIYDLSFSSLCDILGYLLKR